MPSPPTCLPSRLPALLLALAPGLAPGLAAAQPWDGVYLLDPALGCAAPGGALTIAEGVFEGQGARCRMTLPVDVLDMEATLYTMECEGEGADEGERWTERAMLMEAAEGDALYVVWNGYAFRYERCPAGEPASGAPRVGPTDAPAPAAP